jgi:hypothetical protein
MQNFLRDAIAEEILIRFGAKVDERQNGDGPRIQGLPC